MSNHLDLGAFLSDHVSEGTVDSHGEFTVSHSQAARKLAKFALPRSTAWVTKLIQAGNRWGCRAVQIKQRATETLFHFTLPHLKDLPTEDAIVSGLLSGKVGGKGALDAFCTALRSLVEQARLSFILVVDDGEITPRPIYAGQYYSQLSERARLHSRYNPKLGLSLTIYHRPPPKDHENLDLVELVQRMRGYVPIIEELDRYCHVSAVPIILDGRRIDNFVVSPAFGWTDNHRPLCFLGLDELAHSPARLPTPGDFEEKVVSLLSHRRRLARDYGGQRQFQAVAVVSTQVTQGLFDQGRRKRLSSLRWVSDGVIVYEESLTGETAGVRLLLFANADGLDTDLTGFALVDNEAFRLRRHEIFQQAARQLGSSAVIDADYFREDRDTESLADEDHDRLESFRSRIKWLLKGSGTGLTLSLLNPALGLSTTVLAVASTYARKRKDPHARVFEKPKELKERIRGDLLFLRDALQAEQLPESPSIDWDEELTAVEVKAEGNDVVETRQGLPRNEKALLQQGDILKQLLHENIDSSGQGSGLS